MQPVIEYILKNKEWIFSGVGVFVLTGVIFLVRLLFGPRSARAVQPPQPAMNKQKTAASTKSNRPSHHWQGIIPPNSKFEFYSETADSMPAGLQSFSFEYGPRGHAHPLTLKGAVVRAEIQFTCQVFNAYKAMFGANEYALNVLPPRFLTRARGILERFTLPKLRANRRDIESEILEHTKLEFEELGFRLESVTIGAIDKLELTKA